MKLLRANGCEPDRKPDHEPDHDREREGDGELPEGEAQGRRHAAGIEHAPASDMNTREGGLRNIGSTHQRAAISQRQSRRTMTRDARDPRPPQRLLPGVIAPVRAFPALRARTRSALRIAAIATTKTM